MPVDRLPWFRRVGRFGLKSLRPIFLPLLNRVQLRAATAISSSSVASDTQAIIRNLSHLADEQARSTGELFAKLSSRIDTIQIALDAVRLDQRELLDDSKNFFDSQKETNISVLEGLKHQQILLNESILSQTRSITTLSLIMSRADLLLQRFAVPLGREILVRTIDGYVLLPSEDPSLLPPILETGGRLENGTIKILTTLLREGDYVIDVGANIGLTVLPAAHRVGPTGRVIAFEPGSRVSDLLRQSLALNGLSDRVSIHPYAAGEVEGIAHLNLAKILSHSSLIPLPSSESSEEVQVRTIDSIIPAGQKIRLVKIDAEGYEPQVWRGMTRIIAENPDLAVLIEFGPEHIRRAGLSIEEWLAIFQTPGFTAYEVDEPTGHIRKLRPAPDLPNVGSLNFLLLKQPLSALPELRFE